MTESVTEQTNTESETENESAAPDETLLGNSGEQAETVEEGSTADTNEDNTDEGEGDAIAGAPDEYAQYTMPEGVSLDQADVDGFNSLAKELNLNQEQAQKLIDLGVDRETKRGESTMEAYQGQMDAWRESTLTDAEIGGDNADEKHASARKGVEALASDELKSVLQAYHPEENPTGLGLGNHPEVIRLFYRIGKTIGDDSMINPSAFGDKGSESREDVMYEN